MIHNIKTYQGQVLTGYTQFWEGVEHESCSNATKFASKVEDDTGESDARCGGIIFYTVQ